VAPGLRHKPSGTVPLVQHVILSPHPDDAVLSLWHLLTGEEDVAVVNVFGGSPDGRRGDSWWDRLTGSEDSVARIAERHTEDREALEMVGRAPLDLGFLDGQYRDTDDHPVEPIVAGIARAAPEGLLYAPAALDAHRDHRLVLAAALELRTRGREIALYADVPHATLYGWPAWVTGDEPDPNLDPQVYWDHVTDEFGISVGEDGADVHRLEPAERERKLAVLRAYRTQMPALEAAFGVSRPHVLGHEVVWRLP
jgi:LmbE family N-acetylglucosaminyl deacetylase